MPQFTVELAYTVLSCATVCVEAESFEAACAKALEDPPYDDFQDNSESTGEPFVLQIAEGEVDLCEDPNALANVPLPYADEADRLRAERDELREFVEELARLDAAHSRLPPNVILAGLSARAKKLLGLPTLADEIDQKEAQS